MPQPPRTAPALDRGLTMLEMVRRAENQVGFGEFCKALDISKASTARLLRVLRNRGYVAKDPVTGRYGPGPALDVLQPADAVRAHLREEAGPLLQELRLQTGNTAALFHWSGATFELLAKEVHEAAIAMQPVGRVSDRLIPAPWGWLVLASASPAARRTAVREETEYPLPLKTLNRCLGELASRGVAYDDGNFRHGTRRLAAPVADRTDTLRAALVLGGTPFSLPNDRLDSCIDLLREKAAVLSRALGHPDESEGAHK